MHLLRAYSESREPISWYVLTFESVYTQNVHMNTSLAAALGDPLLAPVGRPPSAIPRLVSVQDLAPTLAPCRRRRFA